MTTRTALLRSTTLACLLLFCSSHALAQAEAGVRQDGGAGELSADEDAEWALQHRRFSTRDGSSGGFSVVEPGSGEASSLRFQLMIDTLPGDDFLEEGNEAAQTLRTLSASWTALPALEIFASMTDRGTSVDDPQPASFHTQRALLGFKLFTEDSGLVRFGGGARFAFRNGIGQQRPALKSSDVGLLAAASIDLRDVNPRVPLIARVNLDYLFDNGAVAAEADERARYDALFVPLAPGDEDRHLLTRTERYAFGINRVDTFTVSLGAEAPLAVAERTYLFPLVEWQLGIPVNRQGYNCAVFADEQHKGTPSTNRDSCLGVVGFEAWPMTLTAGLRAAPPLRGVSLAVALDIGLSGTSRFVQELAPTTPYAVTFSVGYDYDARPEPIARTDSAGPPPPVTRPAYDAGAAVPPAADPGIEPPTEPTAPAVAPVEPPPAYPSAPPPTAAPAPAEPPPTFESTPPTTAPEPALEAPPPAPAAEPSAADTTAPVWP